MLRKILSIKKRYFVIPIAVIIVIAAAVIILNVRQKDMLKFSDFTKEENQYCYQGIPWGVDPDTAEKMLKRTLEQLPSTPDYYNAGSVKMDQYEALMRTEFEEGNRLVTVQILFPNAMDDTSVDYSEIESEALEAFKKQYGESSRESESMGIDGLYHRNTAWYSESEDGKISVLAVQASHNKQRVIDLMIATGEIPREIWENMNSAEKNVQSEEFLPTSKNAISLKDLKGQAGFELGNTWNLSLEEIEETLGMELEQLSEVGNVKNYRIPDDVYLVEAEKDAIFGMQFIDEKMQMAAFSMKESDSNVRDQLYQKIGDELKNLYGEPDINQAVNDISESIQWKSESDGRVTMMACENNAKAEEVCVFIHFLE